MQPSSNGAANTVPTWSVLTGNAIDVLPAIPAESVQCCITSPPYFGLRDNGHTDQIGLEECPADYVSKLVMVFREVRRVLKPDGTLFLNLGDTYAGSWGAQGKQGRSGELGDRRISNARQIASHPARSSGRNGFIDPKYGKIKPKDLIGIPWMVAMSLREDGWFLRQPIIWAKGASDLAGWEEHQRRRVKRKAQMMGCTPEVAEEIAAVVRAWGGSPLPDSARDRFGKAYEYVFLLSKRANYYFDREAAREPAVGTRGGSCFGKQSVTDPSGRTPQRKYERPQYTHRTRRNVWTVNTQPFKGLHTSTMAANLARQCVEVGSRPGDCVLDPFAGASTTGVVALRLGRSFLGIELHSPYVEISQARLAGEEHKLRKE